MRQRRRLVLRLRPSPRCSGSTTAPPGSTPTKSPRSRRRRKRKRRYPILICHHLLSLVLYAQNRFDFYLCFCLQFQYSGARNQNPVAAAVMKNMRGGGGGGGPARNKWGKIIDPNKPKVKEDMALC